METEKIKIRNIKKMTINEILDLKSCFIDGDNKVVVFYEWLYRGLFKSLYDRVVKAISLKLLPINWGLVSKLEWCYPGYVYYN